MGRDVMERFFAKIDKPDGEEGCWMWTGTVQGRYGVFRAVKGAVSAHRFLYEALIGPIPPWTPGGYQLRHIGGYVFRCVNPHHHYLQRQSPEVDTPDPSLPRPQTPSNKVPRFRQLSGAEQRLMLLGIPEPDIMSDERRRTIIRETLKIWEKRDRARLRRRELTAQRRAESAQQDVTSG